MNIEYVLMVVLIFISAMLWGIIMYIDRWMWRFGKVSFTITAIATLCACVLPLVIDIRLGLITIPLILLQLRHSWDCAKVGTL